MKKRHRTRAECEQENGELRDQVERLRGEVRDARKGESFLAQHQAENERLGRALRRIEEMATKAVAPADPPQQPQDLLPGSCIPFPPPPKEDVPVVLGRIAEAARVEFQENQNTYSYSRSERRDEREPRWRKA